MWWLLPCAGMREFFLRTSATSNKSFQRIEMAVCFVWSCLLQSAQRNYVTQSLVDSWASIPNGLWGEGRTSAVPGLMKSEAATTMNTRPNAATGAVRGQPIVLPSCWFPFRFFDTIGVCVAVAAGAAAACAAAAAAPAAPAAPNRAPVCVAAAASAAGGGGTAADRGRGRGHGHGGASAAAFAAPGGAAGGGANGANTAAAPAAARPAAAAAAAAPATATATAGQRTHTR